MVWPFSRREPTTDEAEASVPRGRAGDAKRAEAELRAQARRRLIGAAVLLLVAVIAVPMLLDTGRRPLPEDVTVTVETARPANPPAEAPPAPPAKAGEAAPGTAGPELADSPPKAAASAAQAAPASPAAADAPPPQEPPEAAAAMAAAAKAPAAKAPADRFAVQVVALSSAADAEELMVRLIKDGFTAYVEPARTSIGTLHRVRVGPFKTREQAQRAADRLKAGGHRATLIGG
jgi:DedD protein